MHKDAYKGYIDKAEPVAADCRGDNSLVSQSGRMDMHDKLIT